MSWVPDIEPQQRWNPQDETEFPLVVVNRNIQLPSIRNPGDTRVDLTQNVKFGRQPYTFAFGASNFPAGVIVEPNGVFLVDADAPFGLGVQYFALILVRDANNQTEQFTVSTVFIGTGPLVLGGTPPPAHTGVPYSWTPVIAGGTPPFMFHYDGLDFPALGFIVNPYTGNLSGAYNGSLGTSPGNLLAVKVWDNVNPRPSQPIEGYPNTGFAFELATTIDLLDP